MLIHTSGIYEQYPCVTIQVVI